MGLKQRKNKDKSSPKTSNAGDTTPVKSVDQPPKPVRAHINPSTGEPWEKDTSYPSAYNVLREVIPATIIGLLLYFGYPYYKDQVKTFHDGLKSTSKSAVAPPPVGSPDWYPVTKADVSKYTVFSPENLTIYNGELHPRIYLAFLGEVWDVTLGERFYGKEGGYHFFSGKDASRAYVTGQFNEDGLNDDVTDFDIDQIGGLLNWYDFYHNHEEYFKVGTVTGRYFTDKGKQTKYFQKIKVRFQHFRDWTKEQETMRKLHPDCNMQSWENKDGEVWCDKGVPRRIRFGLDKGLDKARCACYSAEEIAVEEPEHALLYPNCEKFSTRCKYFIKDMEQRIIDAFPDSPEALQMKGMQKKVFPAPI
jgi:predicted heme/steroid binding protein